MRMLVPLSVGLAVDIDSSFDVLAAVLAPHLCRAILPDHIDALEDWGGLLGDVPLGALDVVVVDASEQQMPTLAALSRPSRRAGTPLFAVGTGCSQRATALLMTGADSVLPMAASAEFVRASVRASVRAYKRLRSAGRYAEAAADVPMPADLLVRAGPFVADFRTYRVTVGSAPVDLPPRQFDLLVYLMRRPGEVVARDQILRDVWGLAFDPRTNVVNVYVHYLRQRLEALGHPDVLQTVRGRGFMFSPDSR